MRIAHTPVLIIMAFAAAAGISRAEETPLERYLRRGEERKNTAPSLPRVAESYWERKRGTENIPSARYTPKEVPKEVHRHQAATEMKIVPGRAIPLRAVYTPPSARVAHSRTKGDCVDLLDARGEGIVLRAKKVYRDFGHHIERGAKRYGIDCRLVLAVILQESGGDPRARGKAGEVGLMQLMPTTARLVGVTDPWNPEENIHGGIRYLAEWCGIREHGVRTALARYNGGHAAVRMPAAALSYAASVTSIYRALL